MDDLKMLRDLGRDLEHEPPASLAHQRDRMYGRRPARLTRPKSWLVLGVAAAVTASALLAPRLLLDSDTGNLNVLKVPDLAEDVKLAKDLNILVLGSDQRPGRSAKKYGARSDTIIVAHVPVDGSGVKMISIPRDTLVDVPDCERPGGGTAPGGRTMINQAFTAGGADCARKTVENLAGITLDHTVVFGFQTFKKLVDAVGGVELKNTVVLDPETGKEVHRDTITLNGEGALAYARARRGLGDGSDLGRIERQQKLLAALLDKVEPHLDDPAKILKVVDGIAPALDADPKLTPSTMLQVIRVFAQAEDRKVSFATVPWEPAPEDPQRLVLKQPDAEDLWRTLR